jgi:RNA polymerase sigma-70 factor (ECF subfamily)
VVTLVRRQMISIVGATPDLEDLAQSALERLVRCADQFEGRAQFSTFTYRTCARVALNHWRSWRRWFQRFQVGTDDAPDWPDTESEARSASEERALHLYRILERMDPRRRLVLTLCDLEELPASRVAEILECPEPTVRSRLRLARADLAKLLVRDPFFRGGRQTGRGR